jgi:Spy/CpxP family protein refolding chaperone
MNSIRNSIAAALMALGVVSMLPATAAVAAAPPPDAGPGMHGDHHRGPERMFEKLGLSADQKAKVDAIMAAKGPALKNLHEQMRTNMEKLHSIKPDDPNYSALVSQVAQSNGALTTQAISAQGDMHAQLYAVLTPAQRTQLQEMQSKMHDRMKEGGKHWGHRPPPGEGAPGEPPDDAPPMQ